MRKTTMTPAQLSCLFLLTLCLATGYGQETLSGPLKPMTFTIPEGELPNKESYKIFQFQASPPSVTFHLSGETDGLFVINSDGFLFHIKPLDRETRAVHHLQVSTLDAQGRRIEGPVPITIVVEDINDNQPEFLQILYEGSVRQNSRPGRPFMYVNATDKDDPATPNGQLNYEIIAQFPMVNNVKYFQINNKTGGISLTQEGSQKLDVAEKSSYNLVVMAKDSSKPPFSQTANVHVTVTENIWKAPAPVEIVENSTDPHPIKITQVQWNDPGARYTLTEKEKLPRFPFSVDQEGAIFVTQPLDREEKDSYTFYVDAKDESGKLLARPLQIHVKVNDINDNRPTCPSAVTVFEVQENEYIGSIIGTLTAHDMDEENTPNSILRYRLVAQAPTHPSNDLFMIQTYTGDLQLAKQSLKKKNSPQYNLTVAVSDKDFETHCFLQVNVIDINDQIPIFEKSDYGIQTVAEDTAIGTTILTIQATDDDEPFTGSSKIVYRIIEGDSEERLEVKTDPQTNAGYVTIKKLLDFETTDVHNIVFRAENPEPLISTVHYNESSTARFQLIVTDVNEAPQFSLPAFLAHVTEDVPVGTKVGNVTAWDPEHRNIRYSLKGDRRGWLRIDQTTGEIFSKAPLDRETESPYRVQVVASEEGGHLSSEVDFQLALSDVNDNSPRLMKDYMDLFLCHPLKGPGSVTFGATDDDVPPQRGSRFTFSFGRDNSNENWELSTINRTHAMLTTKHTKFEEKLYHVEIRINDNGQPPLERTVLLPVNVCRCELGSCYRAAGHQPGMPTVGMAVGILLTTFLVIEFRGRGILHRLCSLLKLEALKDGTKENVIFGVDAVKAGVGIILAVVFMRIKKKDRDNENASAVEVQPLK